MYAARNTKLRRLGFQTYAQYLASPAWATAKARYRASDEPQACMCGDADVQIHHKTYERVGAELAADLMALCRRCHAMVHVLERRGDMGIDLAGLEDAERAIEGRAYLDDRQAAIDTEREAARLNRAAALVALSLDERIKLLHKVGRSRHIDMSGPLRALSRMRERGKLDALERCLSRYERRIHQLDPPLVEP